MQSEGQLIPPEPPWINPDPFTSVVKVLLARLNIAFTVLASDIVAVQELPEGVHGPDQPANVDVVEVGVAVRVTEEPSANGAAQVAPQLIPLGEDVTVPVPLPPVFVTVRIRAMAKFAVTLLGSVIVRTQLPVAFVQAPDHPANTDPGEAL